LKNLKKNEKICLSQFLDITVFEQLYQLAADEIKETAGKLKEYKKTDFAEIIYDADTIISNNQEDIHIFRKQEDKLQEEETFAK
jgi:hypothetical protein